MGLYRYWYGKLPPVVPTDNMSVAEQRRKQLLWHIVRYLSLSLSLAVSLSLPLSSLYQSLTLTHSRLFVDGHLQFAKAILLFRFGNEVAAATARVNAPWELSEYSAGILDLLTVGCVMTLLLCFLFYFDSLFILFFSFFFCVHASCLFARHSSHFFITCVSLSLLALIILTSVLLPSWINSPWSP